MKYKIGGIRSMVVVICALIFTTCISQINKRTTTGEVDTSTTISNTNKKKMQTDYNPIPLPRLIGMADLTVTGSITSVQDSTFTFQVSQFLTGDLPSKSIEVKKYIPVVFFSPRSMPYMKQQRFALFLQKPNQQDAPEIWNILGYAGEGELPIDDAFIYLESTDLEGLPKKTYDVHGIKRVLQRYGLPEFKDAVKDYQSCFSWDLETYTKNDKQRERWVASKSCNENGLSDYRSKSWLHDYLARETLSKIQKSSDD